jgi:hypothetical protein
MKKSFFTEEIILKRVEALMDIVKEDTPRDNPDLIETIRGAFFDILVYTQKIFMRNYSYD